ncbi:hypothetical protein GW17_00037949, partial [Ensete ventricosum]
RRRCYGGGLRPRGEEGVDATAAGKMVAKGEGSGCGRRGLRLLLLEQGVMAAGVAVGCSFRSCGGEVEEGSKVDAGSSSKQQGRRWWKYALGRENIAAEAAGGMASVPLLVGADATLVVHEEDDLMHKDALAKE